MEQYTITGLFVYPVKSLSAIEMSEVVLTSTGFKYDRHWMLVDKDGNFITQREIPQLVLFNLEINEDRIRISHPLSKESISLSGKRRPGENAVWMNVKIWNDQIDAVVEEEEINIWFSDLLKRDCRMIYVPDEITRPVKDHENAKIHFVDSNQLLLTGESSLEYLNMIATSYIPMDRFRPNIVFKGGKAFDEDQWQTFSVGDTKFEITESCARCKITAIDQKTGELGKEPILTLTRYRKENEKLYFGRYLKITESTSEIIRVGQKINVLELISYL